MTNSICSHKFTKLSSILENTAPRGINRKVLGALWFAANSSTLIQVSREYRDREGNEITLWKNSIEGLVATIYNSNNKSFLKIDGENIINGLNRAEYGNILLSRLEANLFVNWRLIIIDNKIYVWPYTAAGAWEDFIPNDGTVTKTIEAFQKNETKATTLCKAMEVLYLDNFYTEEPGSIILQNNATGERIQIPAKGVGDEGCEIIRNLLAGTGQDEGLKYSIVGVYLFDRKRNEFGGLVFKHPFDESHTVFHVDFSEPPHAHIDVRVGEGAKINQANKKVYFNEGFGGAIIKSQQELKLFLSQKEKTQNDSPPPSPRGGGNSGNNGGGGGSLGGGGSSSGGNIGSSNTTGSSSSLRNGATSSFDNEYKYNPRTGQNEDHRGRVQGSSTSAAGNFNSTSYTSQSSNTAPARNTSHGSSSHSQNHTVNNSYSSFQNYSTNTNNYYRSSQYQQQMQNHSSHQAHQHAAHQAQQHAAHQAQQHAAHRAQQHAAHQHAQRHRTHQAHQHAHQHRIHQAHRHAAHQAQQHASQQAHESRSRGRERERHNYGNSGQANYVSYGAPSSGIPLRGTRANSAVRRIGEHGYQQAAANKGQSIVERIARHNSFYDDLNSKGLVKSYNSSNPNAPAERRGSAKGDIGGVGLSVGIIEGLQDNISHILEYENWFALPTQGSMPPFSQGELKQIIRELANGIFVENTVPFFSLDFNLDCTMCSTISPVYQDTLIGRVISLLDYFMKGFLNGGFFSEKHLDLWTINSNHDQLNSKFKSMENYCKKHIGAEYNYVSLNQMMDIFNINTFDSLERDKSTLIGKQKFPISFRIIAKQTEVEKLDELFVLHPDFDVFYTIETTPEYQEHLDNEYANSGSYPSDWQNLNRSCIMMAESIKNDLPKLPFCKHYFQMLHVINFLSSYFNTLKNLNKIPVLEKAQKVETRSCPSVFPSLPIQRLVQTEVEISLKGILEYFPLNRMEELKTYIASQEEEEFDKQEPIPLHSKRALINTLGKIIPKSTNNLEKIKIGIVSAFICKLINILLHSAKSDTNLTLLRKNMEKSQERLNALQLQMIKIDTEEQEQQKQIDEEAENAGSFAGSLRMRAAIKRAIKSRVENEIKAIEEKIKLEITEKSKIASAITNRKKELLVPFLLPQITEKITTKFPLQVSLTNMPSQQELAENQKRHIAEIRGGCGLALKNMQPILNPSRAAEIYDSTAIKMHKSENEAWNHVKSRENEYFVFKLETRDYHAVSEDDYRKHLGSDLLESSVTQDNGFKPIHLAAAAGDAEELLSLIQKKRSTINLKTKGGLTALYLAAQHGHVKCVRLLIAHNADLNTVSYNGFFPLTVALFNGHEDCARALIEHKEINPQSSLNLDARLANKATALHLACASKSPNIVRLLLQHGAKAAIKRKDRLYPIHLAAQNGDKECCAYIVQKERSCLTQINAENYTALHFSALNGHEGVTLLLVREGANVNALTHDGKTALMLAIERGQGEIAAILAPLTDKNLLNKNKESALHIACQLQLFQISDLLVKQGYDIHQYDQYGLTYLHYLAQNNEYSRLEALYYMELVKENPVTKNEQRLTLHDMAFLYGSEGFLFKLQEFNLMPQEFSFTHIPNGSHYNYIQLATKHGMLGMVQKYFRQRNANPHCPVEIVGKDFSKTLAYIAAENGQEKVLDFILKQGGVLSNGFGEWNVFAGVVKSNKPEFVENFLCAFQDFDPNMVLNESTGETAAHIAAEYGSYALLKACLRCGVSFSIPTVENRLPVHIVMDSQDADRLHFFINPSFEFNFQEEIVSYMLQSNNTVIFDYLVKVYPDRLKEHINSQGNNILFEAIEQNREKFVLKMIQLGLSVNEANLMGEQPIHVAAKIRNEVIINTLIRAGADLNVLFNNQSALAIAFAHNNRIGISVLSQQPIFQAELKNNKLKLIEIAQNNKECMAYLKNTRAEIEVFEKELLQSLVTDNIDSFLKNMNLLGAHCFIYVPQFKGYRTPFQIACLFKKENFIFKLLELGTDISLAEPQEGLRGIHFLADTGDIELLKKVITQFDIPQEELFKVDFKGNNILHLCASKGDHRMVKFLIEKYPLCKESKNYAGENILHISIIKRHQSIFYYLLREHMPLHVPTKKMEYPLYLAVKSENFDFVKVILAQGCRDINELNSTDFETALHAAVHAENVEIAYYLMTQGAKIFIEDKKGQTVLHIAAQKGLLPLIQLFCGNPENSIQNVQNKLGHTPLYLSILHEQQEATQVLLQNKMVNVNLAASLEKFDEGKEISKEKSQSNQIHTPLMQAISSGDMESAKRLIEQNAKITKYYNFDLLNYSVLSGNLVFVKYIEEVLEAKKIIPDYAQAILTASSHNYLNIALYLQQKRNYSPQFTLNGHSALHTAAATGASRTAALFLGLGDNPLKESWKDKETAFSLAIKGGHVNSVKILMDQVDDLDELDAQGESALHYAAQHNQLQLIALFISEGAYVDNQNKLHETPILLASQKGNLNAVKYLAYAGADILRIKKDLFSKRQTEILEYTNHFLELRENHPTDTYIHTALRAGDKEMLIWTCSLYEVDVQNAQKQTPLHLAVCQNMLWAVPILLKRNPNCDIVDENGHTLYDICEQNKMVEMKDLLTKPVSDQIDSEEKIAHVLSQIENKEVSIVEALRRGFPAKTSNSNRDTLLMLAAKSADMVAVKILIKKYKLDPNMMNKQMLTPFTYLVKNTSFADFKDFLEECSPFFSVLSFVAVELLNEFIKNPDIDLLNKTLLIVGLVKNFSNVEDAFCKVFQWGLQQKNIDVLELILQSQSAKKIPFFNIAIDSIEQQVFSSKRKKISIIQKRILKGIYKLENKLNNNKFESLLIENKEAEETFLHAAMKITDIPSHLLRLTCLVCDINAKNSEGKTALEIGQDRDNRGSLKVLEMYKSKLGL